MVRRPPGVGVVEETRAEAQEVDLGLRLGGKEGEGAESNNLYAVGDLFLFLALASQPPNLFLTVPTKWYLGEEWGN